MSYDLSGATETMAKHAIEGQVQVEIGYMGEGLHGDYNAKDPSDVPLLRIDAIDLTDQKRSEQDCSFCTLIPATTPKEVLESVCRHVALKLKDLDYWHRAMERISWLDQNEAVEIHRNMRDKS